MELVIAFIALAAMEIVLGIDNIVFIAIVSGKLPPHQQPLARKIGLMFALVTRLILLFALYYIVHYLTDPVFLMTDIGIPEALINRFAGESEHGFAEANGVSWKDLILLGGGLFLVGKSVYEIHEEFNQDGFHPEPSKFGFVGVIIQIGILDIIFSLDSVITAVGMVDNVWVMAGAIIIAVAVMLIFAEQVSRFVTEHPTLKMLALSFLILIGVMLVAESIGSRMDKGYIYFAMTFALGVEFLNLRIRTKKNKPQIDNKQA